MCKAPIGAYPFWCSSYSDLLMRFKLPFNDSITVRAFERVETVDDQYDIVDVGVEYATGRIDSIAVGGSFSTLKKWTAPSPKDSKGDTPASKD